MQQWPKPAKRDDKGPACRIRCRFFSTWGRTGPQCSWDGGVRERSQAEPTEAAAAKLPAKVAKRTAARSAAGTEAAGKKKKKKDKKAKKERKDKKDKKGKRDKKDKKEKRARGPEEAAKKAKLADTAHATTDSKGLLVRTHGKHSSRYLGVSLNRSTGKWQATLVQPSGSREDLGQFGTEDRGGGEGLHERRADAGGAPREARRRRLRLAGAGRDGARNVGAGERRLGLG
ncbi:unnamed protein product, partial [Prorocentrum cordatum]